MYTNRCIIGIPAAGVKKSTNNSEVKNPRAFRTGLSFLYRIPVVISLHNDFVVHNTVRFVPDLSFVSQIPMENSIHSDFVVHVTVLLAPGSTFVSLIPVENHQQNEFGCKTPGRFASVFQLYLKFRWQFPLIMILWYTTPCVLPLIFN